MNPRWLERLVRWNMKLQTRLQGRYARFDQLNRLLLFTKRVAFAG